MKINQDSKYKTQSVEFNLRLTDMTPAYCQALLKHLLAQATPSNDPMGHYFSGIILGCLSLAESRANKEDQG